MNVQQEGLGLCGKCGTPIMQTINQPGKKGICFGCAADAEQKTGRTLIVTGESGEGTSGKVQLQEVEHVVGESSPVLKDAQAVRDAIAAKAASKGGPVMPTPTQVQAPVQQQEEGLVVIKMTVDELYAGDVLITLLQAIYDGIDNMPPFKTIKETKKALAVQESVEKQLAKLKGETNE